MNETWQTSKRNLSLARTLVMGILNVTPDSFSDGGLYSSVDSAVRRAEEIVSEGADIIDIGGESTRPGSKPVDASEEVRRVVPLIEAVVSRFDIPVSIDTSKAEVARAAVKAGAEIINDISGLRFDERIAGVAAENRTGLVLMHSRGVFRTMHSQPPVEEIIPAVCAGLHRSIRTALSYGVSHQAIALDVGIGFGKTVEQNLELLANLDRLTDEFPRYPMVVGISRKSFIGKILDDAAVGERLQAGLAASAVAVGNGAVIVRTHDVRETVHAMKMLARLSGARTKDIY